MFQMKNLTLFLRSAIIFKAVQLQLCSPPAGHALERTHKQHEERRRQLESESCANDADENL